MSDTLSLKNRLLYRATTARKRGHEAEADDLEAAAAAVEMISGQEIERLRSIEQHAWHLLDEGGRELPDLLDGHKNISAQDLKALDALLSHVRPQNKLAPVSFQGRVKPWMMACFGEKISGNVQERGDRFLEESLELLQANGYDPLRIATLRDYVWGRPVGDKQQEVGGVMITLAAYCLAMGIDMHLEGENELARIWSKIEQIRAKQASKPNAYTPLPIQFDEPTPPEDAVPGCGCEHCLPLSMQHMRMIVCALCGNKRCPHATHHANSCTESNEPGQKGSSWENFPVARKI